MLIENKYRKRCKRSDHDGQAHYLTFSCFRKQPFLRSERTCCWLIDAVKTARREYPFELWAWVFMPDHVHLLLLPRPTTKISDVLRAIKEPVAKRAVAWVRREVPGSLPCMSDIQPNGKQTYRFWQRGGGYDRNLYSTEEVYEKITYMHHNPLRRGLVNKPCAWPWSSCRAWEEGIDGVLPLDRSSLPPVKQ